MKKKYTKYTLILILIIILVIFYYMSFKEKYLNKVYNVIIQNNEIIIKNKINSFISNNKNNNIKNIYNIVYGSSNEIKSANLNIDEVNNLLSSYIDSIKREITDDNQNKYLANYFKTLSTNKHEYLVIPMGFYYSNPLANGIGPKIIFDYDLVNAISMQLDLEVNSYGINNSIVRVYLSVAIDQNIFKPFVKKVNSLKYRFLISSDIVYGNIPLALGSKLTDSSNIYSSNN